MKQITFLCIMTLLFAQSVFSQTDMATAVMLETASTPTSYGTDLVQGLEAYKSGNWKDALFFLRKAASFPDTASDDVWYLMIMAEINLRNYDAVLRDGETFLNFFSDSVYIPEITYQTIIARFYLQRYDEAILGFTAFIEQYPEHNLVSSALFWTAESLYQSYEFERSLALYNRLVVEYPESSKYIDSVFRIELLMQREREEKLLYLLRVTGEEAVAAKEDYERQIKQLQSEEAITLRQKLQELERQYIELQVKLEETTLQNENLENRVTELISLNEELRILPSEPIIEVLPNSDQTETSTIEIVGSTNDDKDLLILELREKAVQLQKLLDEEEGN